MQHFLVHLLYILFNLFDEFLLFLKLHFEALAIFEVFLDLFEFAFLHRGGIALAALFKVGELNQTFEIGVKAFELLIDSAYSRLSQGLLAIDDFFLELRRDVDDLLLVVIDLT